MPERVPVPRPAARVLMVDQEQRLLLFRTDDWRPGVTLWVPPGGGVQEGESFEDAARREIWEETGLSDCQIGPCVWVRSHVFQWEDNLWNQQERYFLVRCETFAPVRDHLEAHELHFINDYQWWAAPDLAVSKDYFVPRHLAKLLPPLLAGEIPAEPFDCGV